jgi:hypothetical protein
LYVDSEKSMMSKIKIYGPPIGKAVVELQKLANDLPNIFEGHIGSGVIPSGEAIVGDYDFVFHWSKKPNEKQLIELINDIDDVLKDLGCRYSITTVEDSRYPFKL